MTLDEYLTNENLTAAEFGGRVGMSEASISRIRRGEQNITRDAMQRIIAASYGAISASSLVHGDPPPFQDPPRRHRRTAPGMATA